jgi:sigma-B regulation protein RsbU (phosphoserine phosphatase)
LIEEHVAATVAANFGLLVAMIGVVFLVAFTLSRKITDPIGAIVIAARKLTAGDFSARAEVRTKDELEDLAGAFNEMGPALQDRVRMQQSLGLAMGVQQNLLPSGSPTIEGLDIAGLSVYCDETGGDYYDFLETDAGLGLILGDVTGHGVAAALLMTSARAMLRSRLALPGEPHEQIADVNDQLSHDASEGRFMTMLYLTIAGAGSPEPGAIHWVNAGHDPAFLYDPAEDSFTQLGEGGGIPLGVAAKWPYTTGGHPGMPPGALLFIGTDGIWEAADTHGKMFGKPRLEAVLKACAGKPAQEVCEAVRRSRMTSRWCVCGARNNRPWAACR